MSIPFPSEPGTRVSELHKTGYSAVFRLPLKDENQERIFETIESTFKEQVTRETVALLPKTDRVEFAVGDRQLVWEKTRRDWRGKTSASVIGIERHGDLDPDTLEKFSEELISFAREYDVPDRSFAGIDSAILDDIGKLRLSARSDSRMTTIHLSDRCLSAMTRMSARSSTFSCRLRSEALFPRC
ncbi:MULTISPECIES: hypothetical protein [unclassified Natrinema]|uniref:hypothetical protein n=1 Tax=unclassified Natrinema TaxID=2622230 RepID=UPI00026D5316|nr:MULTISPECIES: hypothetical protein [unclassified Natrinema]AFO57504.1 hypothetical protein NJ7G_2266 [Natrinema sp. J7-2]